LFVQEEQAICADPRFHAISEIAKGFVVVVCFITESYTKTSPAFFIAGLGNAHVHRKVEVSFTFERPCKQVHAHVGPVAGAFYATVFHFPVFYRNRPEIFTDPYPVVDVVEIECCLVVFARKNEWQQQCNKCYSEMAFCFHIEIFDCFSDLYGFMIRLKPFIYYQK
jgi:hypothetical protein